MASARPMEIGVEGSRSRADQEPMIARYPDDAFNDVDDALIGEFGKPSIVGKQHGRIKSMPPANLRHVDREVAHQTLDELRAQAVLVGQPVAPGGRQSPGSDRTGIEAEANLVLDISRDGCGR